ncbi:leucyl aminopeptidase [Shewanella schlegeliana]|uniref:Probable cytosol aminopeptidase n=1 Tax=Shewanella schlegeliana TaxID=190308 RepID=A0ABS1T7N2_9GAMM|nr:leucyl aminopeptidase [Shewanella schlegeliana]MBL4915486.1 leucyl aminopeptidase [Shewanella schlegeliana]MCL1111799.1 leucyl aminopeptidase [Shewanella schlegeliana]GIU36574.1 putative cytosol aminopeptidase 1 [Shewanella schlegeliana]
MLLKKTLLTSALSLSLLTTYSAQAETFDFVEQRNNSIDTLVIFQAGDKASPALTKLDKQSKQQISSALALQEFTGEKKQLVEILMPTGIDAKRLVVVGIGDESALTPGEVNKLGANITAHFNGVKVEEIQLLTDGISDASCNASFAAQLAHGINLRAYKFDKYLSEKKPAEKNYTITVSKPKDANKQYSQLAAIEQGVFLARDLTSETPTEMTPVDFANATKELKKLGVKVTVLEPKEIEKLGMGALHAVGRGSKEGARLVIAHWQGNDDAPIALVGKGITFDSGGYNIKASGDSISRMKSDMAGAAAVVGAVKAMALQKADINLVAVMPMAANMVSETALAPGDVLMTAEGLSVEVLNTDAEGRLILADGMWYAREHYQPQVMVDVATLTGSKVRALGKRYTAVISDDDALVNELTFSGQAVDEKLWRLPLAYEDLLKSPIADLKNAGFGGPGATTAAAFLKQFSGDTKWAHLDIAGSALASKDVGVTPIGGTGHGVRLLSHWIMTQSK